MKRRILYFFLIGLFIYIIDIGSNYDESKDIFISDQEIISLVNAWKSQVGRDPTDDEIARIINNLVNEEVLYREAIALGLDKEDRIIKRRLAQKISFLKQESVIDKPSYEEISRFYDQNKDSYYISPTFTFTHHFFTNENNSLERSNQAILNIKNNKNISSDVFFLGKNFAEINMKGIESNFGVGLEVAFSNPDLNIWTGPYKSPFGHHLLFITSVKDGYYPDIKNIYKELEVDYIQLKRDVAVDNFINKVRSDYSIIINPDLKI